MVYMYFIHIAAIADCEVFDIRVQVCELHHLNTCYKH